tara:strand:- start:14753 stop:15199 length:447 start_codon:yes stop_codon:yes gene_type:complete
MDNLIECKRCKGNACYEQKLTEEVTTSLCWGCGFTTSTLMTEGSEIVKQALESSPELYKDLLHKDVSGLTWLPATITLPEKGMVFIDGTAKDSWRWAAVKAIRLQQGDTKVSEEQTHKMDMRNVKHFEQKDFMDSCEHIGMFEVGDSQ